MGKKYVEFDVDGTPKNIYDDEIHENIPDSAVPVTDQQWEILVKNIKGLYVWDPASNDVVLYTPPSEDLLKKKEKLIKKLKKEIEDYILEYYPLTKQQSDVSDKEFWVSWLVKFVVDASTGNPVYTVDGIYEKGIDLGYQYWLGGVAPDVMLNNILTNEKPNYAPSPAWTGTQTAWDNDFSRAWDQIIKASIRIGFVRMTKLRMYATQEQIDAATTEAELDAIQIPPPGLPTLPPELM